MFWQKIWLLCHMSITMIFTPSNGVLFLDFFTSNSDAYPEICVRVRCSTFTVSYNMQCANDLLSMLPPIGCVRLCLYYRNIFPMDNMKPGRRAPLLFHMHYEFSGMIFRGSRKTCFGRHAATQNQSVLFTHRALFSGCETKPGDIGDVRAISWCSKERSV